MLLMANTTLGLPLWADRLEIHTGYLRIRVAYSNNQEWNILKAHLDDNQEGAQLKKWGGSGFDALMVGKVETGYLAFINSFKSMFMFSGRKAFFWTSEKKLGLASFKSLDDLSTTIQQGTTAPNEQAFSVRCIKNPPFPMTVAGINYDTVEMVIKYGR
ncbi:hypothetical protein BSPWISOXPB_6255 [uncultured Gammaproteobacteria bacterium]|nr:hypothetical protein BSPWISOXPB_6255 [uncultured Gammaproteobacteria bacterium]